MKRDIVHFINRMKSKYGIEALYFADNDVYSLRMKGRGVQNFDSLRFYQVPKRQREAMLLPLIKIGLAHNLGEKIRDKLFLNRKQGKRI